MYNDFGDALVEVFTLIVLAVVVVAATLLMISVPIYFSNKKVCEIYSMDLETDFGFWQGCMVKDPKSGIWVDVSKIETINGTIDLQNEGL